MRVVSRHVHTAFVSLARVHFLELTTVGIHSLLLVWRVLGALRHGDADTLIALPVNIRNHGYRREWEVTLFWSSVSTSEARHT
jgi:hypothetical protein